MKPIEQLVAAIRELRFALDRLTDEDVAGAQPTAKQTLTAQAQALQVDVDTLLKELDKPVDAESELAAQ